MLNKTVNCFERNKKRIITLPGFCGNLCREIKHGMDIQYDVYPIINILNYKKSGKSWRMVISGIRKKENSSCRR